MSGQGKIVNQKRCDMYIKKMLISLHIFILGCLNVIKLAVWLFAIQTIVSLFSIVLITDSENPSEIIKALSIVMVLSSLMIMFFISKSSAYSDFEIYKNNLIRKRRKDEAGNFRNQRNIQSGKRNQIIGEQKRTLSKSFRAIS